MDRTLTSTLIIGKLLNLGGTLEKEGNRVLSAWGINHQQFTVLFEIASEEVTTQKEMCNRLRLEKSHISRIIKKLIKMGLITSEACKRDKRSSYLKTTERGKKVINPCLKSLKEWNRKVFLNLSNDELETILKSLTQVQSEIRHTTSLKKETLPVTTSS